MSAFVRCLTVVAVLWWVLPSVAGAQGYSWKAIKLEGAFDTHTVGINDFGSVVGHWVNRNTWEMG